MKIKLLVVSSLLLTMGLIASEHEVQLVAGKNFVDCKSILKDSKTAGIRVNKFLSTNNGLQLAYDKVRNIVGSKDAHRYSANYIHQQNDNNSNAHPFILLGGGYEDGAINSQGFYNAGAGISYAITDKVNLIGEVKGIKKHNDNNLDINTNVGFGIKIGTTTYNKPITEDATLNYIAPKIVKRKYITVEPLPAPVFSDDKVNCVK